MADFLNNLLNRNSAPGPAAGPVLRPRPLTPYESTPSGQPIDAAAQLSADGPAPAGPTPPPETGPNPDLSWLAAWRSRLAAGPSPVEPAHMIPPPAPPSPRSEPASPTGEVPTQPSLQSQHPAETVQPPAVLREIHHDHPSTVMIPAPLAAQPAQAVIMPSPAPQPEPVEDTPRRLDPLTPAAPAVPAGERGGIQPAERGQVTADQRLSDQPPAPVIHVTIGRIEVRAAPAAPSPAAAPAARQGPAVMTLEEYLNRRNGGQR